MRRAHRLDRNHAELTRAFEKLGCTVLSLAGLGKGAPDALIGFAGLCICVEYKDAQKPPSARKLTPDEIKFRHGWTGGYRIVETTDQVLDTVNVLRGWHERIRGN